MLALLEEEDAALILQGPDGPSAPAEDPRVQDYNKDILLSFSSL